MLNADLKQQLKQLLELMEGDVEFVAQPATQMINLKNLKSY